MELDALDQRFCALCEMWGKEPSTFFAAMYREALLKELSFDDAVKALEIPFHRKFFGFPQSGELVELMRGEVGDPALLAWQQYMEAMGRHGVYRTVEFQDGRIARTIELMGGWIQSGEWLVDDLEWKRKDFMKIYNGLPASMSKSPGLLTGIHRANNSNRNMISYLGDEYGQITGDEVVKVGIADRLQIESKE